MNARLRRMWGAERKAVGPKRPEHGPVGPCHETGAWLDVVCKLLRLPREETEGIRAELDEHLRERVRDLMVEGEPEEAATRRAISELGDAAALADRFRRAEHTPRRRMLMNIAMLGMAAGVAVAGAVGLNKLSGPPGASGVASPPQVRFASADVGEKTITLAADATLDRFVQELGRVTGKGTHVYWDSLQDLGLDKDMQIGVPMAGVTIETALMLVNERVKSGDQKIACRVTGDLLEISTLHHFDKRAMTLVAYDMEAALSTITAENGKGDVSEQLTQLIKGVIDPEQWKDNGGELAELYRVGPKLFVKAPARFQPTVQWILAQLGSGKAASAAAGEQVEKTSFTASGDRVTMARAGKQVIADAIELDPAKGRIEATGKGVEVRAAADPSRLFTYSITGQVEHPGVYCMPREGMSLRRAIVAGGGKFEGVKEVVVTKTENGLVSVTHRVKGEELGLAGAKDPMLADGEVIEVK